MSMYDWERETIVECLTSAEDFPFCSQASDFSKRNEFLLVFIVKSTDVDCLDYQKQAAMIPGQSILSSRILNSLF